MAVKTVNVFFDLSANVPRLVHRSVAKRFSVEVKTPGIVTIEMRRKRGSFRTTDFEFLTLGETIPTGAIFARLVPNPADPLTIELSFEVRTGSDFTGQPRFSARR
jgi:hypothetical protein